MRRNVEIGRIAARALNPLQRFAFEVFLALRHAHAEGFAMWDTAFWTVGMLHTCAGWICCRCRPTFRSTSSRRNPACYWARVLMARSPGNLCDSAELTCTALDARARAFPSFQRGVRALLAVAYENALYAGFFRRIGPEDSEVSAVESWMCDRCCVR